MARVNYRAKYRVNAEFRYDFLFARERENMHKNVQSYDQRKSKDGRKLHLLHSRFWETIDEF